MQRLCLVQNQLDLFFMQIYFHQRQDAIFQIILYNI